jgi:hypothetical protein
MPAPTGACAPLCAIMSDMKRTERITVRLSSGECAVLDEFRGPATRSAYLRRLVREASPDDGETPDHREAMRLLAQAARAGATAAVVHYERATRPHDRGGHEPDAELERLLRDG